MRNYMIHIQDSRMAVSRICIKMQLNGLIRNCIQEQLRLITKKHFFELFVTLITNFSLQGQGLLMAYRTRSNALVATLTCFIQQKNVTHFFLCNHQRLLQQIHGKCLELCKFARKTRLADVLTLEADFKELFVVKKDESLY